MLKADLLASMRLMNCLSFIAIAIALMLMPAQSDAQNGQHPLVFEDFPIEIQRLLDDQFVVSVDPIGSEVPGFSDKMPARWCQCLRMIA